MNGITDFTSQECRLKAEAKLALADRGGPARETLLADASAWLLLAAHVDFIDSAMAAARRKLH
jgi:hypothetical protein